jgi:hypothetical protein
MSFSENKQKICSVPDFSFQGEDLGYLEKPAREIQRDHAVETLVDEIREVSCLFRFKLPLGQSFCVAADHAMNCFDASSDLLPRKMNNWIRDCLKCCDCICLVYWQDVLKRTVSVRSSGSCYERDVYDSYMKHDSEEIRSVGASLDKVYELCRNPLEHTQVMRNGRREIKKIGSKELYKKHNLSREMFRLALDKLVPRYRKAFPESCLEGAKTS